MAAGQEEETAMLKAGTPQSDDSDATKSKTTAQEESGEGEVCVMCRFCVVPAGRTVNRRCSQLRRWQAFG